MKLTLKKQAILALCIVALSFSLLNVGVRMLGTGFSPFTQVYLRTGLGLLLISLIFHKELHPSKIQKISKKDWLILIAMGTLGYGIAVDFVTLGVLHTTLLNASVIGSTTPFFIMLFSIVFLRKSYPLSLLFFVLLTFYGILVMATGSFMPVLNNFGIGDFFVLLYAAGVGVYIFGRKMLSTHLNNSEIAWVVILVACVTALVTAAFAGETLQLSGFLQPLACAGFLMGGALNVVATKLQNFSYPHLNPVIASQLLLLTNVFALIFGYVFYHEIIQPVEFAGAVLVLMGVWACIKQTAD